MFSALLTVLLLAMGHAEQSLFAPTLECSGTPPVDYCQAVDPQPWTENEMARVLEIMERPELGRARALFAKLKSKLVFYRFNFGADYVNDIEAHKVRWVRNLKKSALAWYDPVFRKIVLPPQFFKSKGPIDHLSKVPRNDLALIHEVFHMIDSERQFLSLTDEFTHLTKWYWNKSENVWETEHVSQKDVSTQMQTIQSKLKNGDSDWYLIDREGGIALGFPTLYAMTSRQEMFAELAAYILLDPKASTYIDPKIIEWYDEVVFSVK